MAQSFGFTVNGNTVNVTVNNDDTPLLDVLRNALALMGARFGCGPRLSEEHDTWPRKNSAAVANFSDHEVVTPENKLRKAISTKSQQPRRRRSGRARREGTGRTVG